MKNLAFLIWMLGWPIVFGGVRLIAKKCRGGDEVISMDDDQKTGCFWLIIWCIVGYLLYEG